MRTLVLIVGSLLMSGCSCTAPPETIVRVVHDCEPSGPCVLFHPNGRVEFARGPAEYRNPATGRWQKIERGAVVAFAPEPIEFAISTDDLY